MASTFQSFLQLLHIPVIFSKAKSTTASTNRHPQYKRTKEILGIAIPFNDEASRKQGSAGREISKTNDNPKTIKPRGAKDVIYRGTKQITEHKTLLITLSCTNKCSCQVTTRAHRRTLQIPRPTGTSNTCCDLRRTSRYIQLKILQWGSRYIEDGVTNQGQCSISRHDCCVDGLSSDERLASGYGNKTP
jgi:hypothetical protein